MASARIARAPIASAPNAVAPTASAVATRANATCAPKGVALPALLSASSSPSPFRVFRFSIEGRRLPAQSPALRRYWRSFV
jgi:hypothetical protein